MRAFTTNPEKNDCDFVLKNINFNENHKIINKNIKVVKLEILKSKKVVLR